MNKSFFQILLFLAVSLTAVPAFAAGAGGFSWANWGWNFLNFGIFAAIIWKFAIPAMQDFFAKRRSELMAEMDAAKALRLEAKAELERFQAKLKDLEGERQSIMDEYHEQGTRERDRLVADAKKQVEKMRVDAEIIITQETRKAVAAIEKQAIDEAIGLAMTKLTTKMSDDNQNGLVAGFVDELRVMD